MHINSMYESLCDYVYQFPCLSFCLFFAYTRSLKSIQEYEYLFFLREFFSTRAFIHVFVVVICGVVQQHVCFCFFSHILVHSFVVCVVVFFSIFIAILEIALSEVSYANELNNNTNLYRILLRIFCCCRSLQGTVGYFCCCYLFIV